jgi:CheY-like chemotaxis protein/signal transduction histidine kinase
MDQRSLSAFLHLARPCLRRDATGSVAEAEHLLRRDGALAGLLVDGARRARFVARRAFFRHAAESLARGIELDGPLGALAQQVGSDVDVHDAARTAAEVLADELARGGEAHAGHLLVQADGGTLLVLERSQLVAALLAGGDADAGDEAARARRERERRNVLETVGREVRTHVTDFLGTFALLEATELGDEQRDLVAASTHSARALLALLDDMQAYTQLEGDGLLPERADFDLAELFGDVAAQFADEARDKGLEIAVDVDAALPASVNGDCARLRQVLANLVDNAVKYTPAGSVALRARRLDDELRLSVEDTGLGMDAATLQRAFDAFGARTSGTTRSLAGLGLGLAVVQRIVHALGGALECESATGRGTTFTVVLPLVAQGAARATPRLRLLAPLAEERARTPRTPEPSAAAAPAPALAPESAAPAATTVPTPTPAPRPVAPTRAPRRAAAPAAQRAAGARVLVVDDEPVARTFAARVLERAGFAVESSDDGDRALARLAAQPFDLVLMDVQMPLVSGIEATRRLRSSSGPNAKVPVLGLSGNAERATRDRALAAGMQDLLLKPVAAGDLVREVGEAIAARRPAAAAPTWRVLVVDDQAVARRLAQAILTRHGARVRHATDGVEALAALARESFDLVLLDLFMPRLGGIETLTEMRRRGDRTPVVVLSGSDSVLAHEQALALGASGFVQKPVGERELVAACERAGAAARATG